MHTAAFAQGQQTITGRGLCMVGQVVYSFCLSVQPSESESSEFHQSSMYGDHCSGTGTCTWYMHMFQFKVMCNIKYFLNYMSSVPTRLNTWSMHVHHTIIMHLAKACHRSQSQCHRSQMRRTKQNKNQSLRVTVR